MPKYTDLDLERAHATLFGPGMYEQRVAQLIADVRSEERERAAGICDALEAEFVAAYERQTDPERNNDQRCMANAWAQAATLIRCDERPKSGGRT